MGLSYPSLNNRRVSWVSIKLKFSAPGKPSADTLGFKDVSYKTILERSSVYGAGRQIQGYTAGTLKDEASITMLFEEQRVLLAILGEGFMDAPLTWVVSFAEGSEKHTDTIVGALMKEIDHQFSQGPDGLAVTMPFDVHYILYDGKAPIKPMRR